MTERIYIYDTTLRDGAQTQGVSFSPEDKRRIARDLDRLGIDYIEGGWPGANDTDNVFFAENPGFSTAKFCAFGMTRRSGRSASNDPGLVRLFQSTAEVITLVGKSSRSQAEGALGVDAEENLHMIRDSMSESRKHVGEVMYDAEHFFDGFREDPEYALAAIEAAFEGGARWAVLCDTNGGALPHEVRRAVSRVVSRFPADKIGIHTHNDTENAIANTLEAVLEGARQVQGTLNGLGERCGNANLISLIPTLKLKLGFDIGVSDEAMTHLTAISRAFDERLNHTPNRSAAYVGANAFAHKGGLHASAVLKDPGFYEHVNPALVGNQRDILVSDQAGRSNLLRRFEEMNLAIEPSDEQVSTILSTIKEREAHGFSYDGASASFELLVREALGQRLDYFELLTFRVIDERRYNAVRELVTMSEATIKARVNGNDYYTVADGNGPVNALDHALRQALANIYPSLEQMELIDFKVRILSPEAGTGAITRVIIESSDDDGRVWQTIGVSSNIIDASYNALSDAIIYKLVIDGHTPP
ncbi:MAG: citramalate synthase [Geminicoccaceae bacterium]|nr:citramalate synthase [Geminicoccaceae bacterium]MCB9943071.1 citramalate synthase [Geminicoccaceae bacterium]